MRSTNGDDQSMKQDPSSKTRTQITRTGSRLQSVDNAPWLAPTLKVFCTVSTTARSFFKPHCRCLVFTHDAHRGASEHAFWNDASEHASEVLQSTLFGTLQMACQADFGCSAALREDVGCLAALPREYCHRVLLAFVFFRCVCFFCLAARLATWSGSMLRKRSLRFIVVEALLCQLALQHSATTQMASGEHGVCLWLELKRLRTRQSCTGACSLITVMANVLSNNAHI